MTAAIRWAGLRVGAVTAAAEDTATVVDPQLRLRGVKGMPVADDSVVPRLDRGHTAAVAMKIGERAAELIAHPGRRVAVDVDPNEVAS